MASGVIRDREQLEKAFQTISQSYTFDGAHLELASDARQDDIVEFIIEHFLPDEPLSRSIGVLNDIKYFGSLMNIIADNLSVLLVSDVTNKVIGVRIILIIKKSDQDITPEIGDEKMKTSSTFVRHKDSEMDVFKYYGVDVAVRFLALGVHGDYRKMGYASKLMQAAIAFSQELGLDPVCIQGEGTSNFSKSIYEKCGFETLHEMKYDEYKRDGEVVFKNTGEHKSCKIYVKQFA